MYFNKSLNMQFLMTKLLENWSAKGECDVTYMRNCKKKKKDPTNTSND